MPRPLQHWLGFTPAHKRPRPVHPPQGDPSLHPSTATVPWGYPGPSFDSLVAVIGDDDAANTARLVLQRAPDEMRVIVDLLVRLQLERWQTEGHEASAQADDAVTS